MDSSIDIVKFQPIARQWLWRIGILLAAIVLFLAIWITSIYLTHTFAEEERNRDRLRATLYAGSIQSTLQRQAVVPLLLSRDPFLTLALRAGQYQGADERLESFQKELGAGPIFLLNAEGRVVSSSDGRERDTSDNGQAYFIAAIAGDGTEFSIVRSDDGEIGFYYSRKLIVEDLFLGVVVVTVDLGSHQQAWRRSNARVIVSEADGGILLASDPGWQGKNVVDLLRDDRGDIIPSGWLPNASEGFFQKPYVYLNDEPVLLSEVPVGFRSWRLTFFDTLEEVRAHLNLILFQIILGLTVAIALGIYVVSRRIRAENRRVLIESNDLRELNRRLSREVAARERVEKNLKVAEQSLEQASKLAALGQMSAAVSHELNQPLAAMKTYLAGAQLLLKRRRYDEAETSYQRIDNLINRMGGITRQLKSYARKSDMELGPVDLRESVREALTMMAPQLGKMSVDITTTLPSQSVVIQADALRIEQIIVNLLRNALDALRNRDNPQIRVLLAQGEMIVLSVEDNGTGLSDPDKLFEPFYTTKKPGDGLGLGLAISAGFAAEMGGKLVARNAPESGAIFELWLPNEPIDP